MVRCEEEENGENGEGGENPTRFLKKEGVKFVVKEGGRVCLVEGK